MSEQLQIHVSTPQGLTELTITTKNDGGNVTHVVTCIYLDQPQKWVMEYNPETGSLRIADKSQCPYDLHELEEFLSDTIEAHFA